jgi:hypothetical protein
MSEWTKSNPKIKKLSRAILHGTKMCKERGITQTTGSLIRVDCHGEICAACTAGMALIGIMGIDEAVELFQRSFNKDVAYNELYNKFPAGKNTCLIDTLTKSQKDKVTNDSSVYSFIFDLNDQLKLKSTTIAKKLAKCGL